MKGANKFRPKKFKGKKFNPRQDRDRLYDRTWSDYCKVFLSVNPKCYCCGEKATVVDHLRTHKGNISLFRQRDNHIPLCKSDHDYITAKFDRSEKQDYEGKLRFMAWKRDKTQNYVKVRVLPSYGKKPL